MQTQTTRTVDFSNVAEDTRLHDALEEAEETIATSPELETREVASHVSDEIARTTGPRDNSDLETLIELREHDALDGGELDMHRKMSMSPDFADATIEGLLRRSIHMFVLNRIETVEVGASESGADE